MGANNVDYVQYTKSLTNHGWIAILKIKLIEWLILKKLIPGSHR